MKLKDKTFNFTVLFIVLYAVLALFILAVIWWPKDKTNGIGSGITSYQSIDGKQKALDMYTSTLQVLLCENNLPLLYQKLNENYKKEHNINESNYQVFLENAGYISNSINITESSVNIQDNDVYVYRYKYTNNNKTCYVNLIETKPYEYTLSFEQDTIPIVSNNSSSESTNTSNKKTFNSDNIKYEISNSVIRENGITYILQITNNSDKTVEFNFDNITNVSVILNDGKQCNLGAAVISSDEDKLTPNSSLKKELFFAVSSTDQYKIKTMKLRNVKIGDEKKNVSIEI